MPRPDRILAWALNVFYPAACPVCGSPPDSFRTSPVCVGCFRGIAPYSGNRCFQCGEPIPSEYAELCGNCLKDPPPVTRTLFFGLYEGALLAAIHAFKFHGGRRLARPLAELLSGVALPPDASGIIPVPLSKAALAARGYSHTRLLAHSLSRLTGIPVVDDLLFKHKDTRPQVGLKKTERLKNLKGAFAAARPIGGQSFIILDDVITTGATVRECCRTLIRSGAANTYPLALAKTSGSVHGGGGHAGE